MSESPEKIALAFNDAITRGDLAGLGAWMTADHTLIDTEDRAVRGKPAVLEAWGKFFHAFPGYRNIFDRVVARDAAVFMKGRSVCPNCKELDGPALWTARIAEGKISEWRVYHDTDENRQKLGVD